MNNSVSPFLPGRPVPADFFVGRVSQLDRLAERARSAANGRLSVSYLSGERGIGKTSLISFLRQFLDRQFRILGVHVFLSGADSLEETLHRIFDQILRVARQENLTSGVKDPFRISQTSEALGTGDLTLRAPDRELLAIGEHLDTIVHSLMKRLAPRYQGMMLVLDDINGVASCAPFAHWLKSFVDTASTSGVEPPLFLLLSGEEESRQALMVGNPSLDRVLHAEVLGPWSDVETQEFFRNSFERAGRSATPAAVKVMANFCQGRPAIAHRLGDATFRGDQDAHVTEEDAMTGLFGLEHSTQAGQVPAQIPTGMSVGAPVPARVVRPNRALLSVLRSLV